MCHTTNQNIIVPKFSQTMLSASCVLSAAIRIHCCRKQCVQEKINKQSGHNSSQYNIIWIAMYVVLLTTSYAV